MILYSFFKRLPLLFVLFYSTLAAAASGSLLFGVNEGTSSNLDAIFRRDKYAELSAYLGGMTGKMVKTETSNILSILTRNLERKRFDVLLVRPSHISARAMRDQGYRLLVAAKGEAKLHFIVRADSPLKSLQELNGRFIAFPDEMAYPSALAAAALRDIGVDPRKGRMQYMDRQEAVGYSVQEKLADAGVVISYSKVARNWEKEGGRFLYTKDKLPFWSIIVSPNVDAETAEKLRTAFLSLDKDTKGKAILKQIGVEGFVVGDQQSYLSMLDWVDGRQKSVQK